MKFSLSLKYNAVPEWQDHYINYTALKKQIYALQAERLDNSDQSRTKNDSNGEESTGTQPSSSNDLNGMKSKFKKSFKKNIPSGKFFKNKNGSTINQTTIELDDLDSSISRGNFDPYDIFLGKLKEELVKIDAFYQLKETELYEEYDNLIKDLELTRTHTSGKDGQQLSESRSIESSTLQKPTTMDSFDVDLERGNVADEDEDEEEELDHSDSENSALLSDSDINLNSRKRITMKKRTTQLFVDLSQLKSFIELNRIGFSKITKKFDKSLNTHIKSSLIDTNEFFKGTYTFEYETLQNLDDKLDHLVETFATLTNRVGNLDACKAELRSQLREHIVWERSTVWKEMIGLETRANAADIKGTTTGAGNAAELFQLDYYSWPLPFHINLYFTKLENFKIPKFVTSSRAIKLAIIIAITIVLLLVKTFNDLAEHRCMALLACVALLWATEAIPLFVTSILCPLLVVLFKVAKDDDGNVYGAADASSYILSQMWSSTIMVLLGGFTLAAALSKYNIAKVLASYILAFAGTKPRNILLSIMAVALFLSMWISNVASPVLCYSLIQGVLRTLPTESPFAQALILGVALASNIAGMSSPISSPQNIVAMEYLQTYGIGWGQWLGVAIPVSIICLVLTWLLLIFTFKVHTSKVMRYKPIKEKFTLKQWYVCFVTIATIILWCVLSKIEGVFGDSGEIAVFPIVLLFGTGLLSTSDINNFPWSIVILAMGSIALGKAVSSSGLLATIATALQSKVEDFDLEVILIIFGILILVVGTFVSHTVSAIIIIPLVQEIGDSLPGDNSAVVLIFGIALLASCGMGLASSGFPNVTAISMTDEVGKRYLTVNTFITRGVPASFIAYLIIISVGYGIMKSIC